MRRLFSTKIWSCFLTNRWKNGEICSQFDRRTAEPCTVIVIVGVPIPWEAFLSNVLFSCSPASGSCTFFPVKNGSSYNTGRRVNV
uniref:Uncharacterized protein n=1 Tax=Oryza brachyantha TaxID=4533 RepID=J3KYS8_ORYBR